MTAEQGDSQPPIRLLTEAQWEYTARGTEGREYPWGTGEPDPERCNVAGNVGDTTLVGSYPLGTTPKGVQDLAGNVWEWVEDAWHDNYNRAPSDGSAWTDGEAGAGRVIRGGSWSDYARHCRSAYRGWHSPGYRNYNLGFRCARVQA